MKKIILVIYTNNIFKKKWFTAFLFILSLTSFSQKDSIKKKISIFVEQDIAGLLDTYLENHVNNSGFKQRDSYLLGNITIGFNSTKKIKKSIFIGYQYLQSKYIYTPPSPINSIMFLYQTAHIEKENRIYFLTGMTFKFTGKKKLSGFFTSIGFGGGTYSLVADNNLYNRISGWCQSIDAGYMIVCKHVYFKPFIGLLSVFNFKEHRNYHDSRFVNSKVIESYSPPNTGSPNLYKSANSPGPGELLIHYKYLGLTNSSFIPRGLFCIGFTF